MSIDLEPGSRYRVTFPDDMCIEFLYVGLNPETGKHDIEVPPGCTDLMTWEELVTGAHVDLHKVEETS